MRKIDDYQKKPRASRLLNMMIEWKMKAESCEVRSRIGVEMHKCGATAVTLDEYGYMVRKSAITYPLTQLATYEFC